MRYLVWCSRLITLLLCVMLAALYPMAERYMTLARTLSHWRERLGEWPPELASSVLVFVLALSLLWALPRLTKVVDACVGVCVGAWMVALSAVGWIALWLWSPEGGAAYWLQPWWQLGLLLLWLSWLPVRCWARALSHRLIGRKLMQTRRF